MVLRWRNFLRSLRLFPAASLLLFLLLSLRYVRGCMRRGINLVVAHVVASIITLILSLNDVHILFQHLVNFKVFSLLSFIYVLVSLRWRLLNFIGFVVPIVHFK